MKLKLGETCAVALSHHAAMVDVLDGVFGDGKPRAAAPETRQGLPEGVQDLAKGQSAEMAIANINQALRFG